METAKIIDKTPAILKKRMNDYNFENCIKLNLVKEQLEFISF